jgi:DNA-binding beta-propeller fold protein YncE
VENQPQGIGYDSGKGEIFVTYSESNRVSVISDSSFPLPSPSIPEYPPFIVASFLMVTIVLTAIIYRGKHQIETS